MTNGRQGLPCVADSGCCVSLPVKLAEDLCSCLPQVLYLDVAPAQDGLGRLKAVAAAAREHFLSQGLGSCDQRPFTPHVTIAKLSNLKSYAARRSINTTPEVLAGLSLRLQRRELC